MKDLFVIGMSHRTAPVELRERLAVPDDELGPLLAELRAIDGVSGVLATATCNRFEVVGTSERLHDATAAIRDWIAGRTASDAQQLDGSLYTYTGEAAVKHVFRVAASLDSMVVGEAQILGQIKSALRAASDAGTLDRTLTRCVNAAVRAAKHVRSETGIAKNPVSVPHVSVQLARKIFGELSGRTVLLIGAGEVSELAARSLRDRGIGEIHIVNRDLERARKMALPFEAIAHGMDSLADLLGQADIVMSSTGAGRHMVTVADVKAVWRRRRHRPLFLIDLAVPRDLDPALGSLPNVYLFDIDDLQQIAQGNEEERRREARAAERMVAEQASGFLKSQRTDSVTPTIVRLREKLYEIKDHELERGLGTLSHLSEEERAKVARMATTLVNRILHEPTVGLKRLAEEGTGEEAIELLERLFNLEGE